MKQLFFFLKGFVVGLCDLVPGISGGTMAFLMGIYERLISVIRNIDHNIFFIWRKRRFKKAIKKLDLPFSIPFGIGLLLAIFAMANFMSYMVNQQPIITYAFLLGLIAGSLYLLSTHFGKITTRRILLLLLGVGIGLAFSNIAQLNLQPITPILILSGFFAACAMLLPGVSGSYVLVVLGQYEYILESIATRHFTPLILLAIGVLFGLYLMSHTIAYLLQKKRQLTLFFLFGLVLGSLRLFFIKIGPAYNEAVVFAIALGLLIPLGILFIQKVVKIKLE